VIKANALGFKAVAKFDSFLQTAIERKIQTAKLQSKSKQRNVGRYLKSRKS
jgi:hypothetical protein